MNDDAFEKRLQKKLADMTKAQAPTRDLWPGIEYALDRQKHSRSTTAIASCLLLFACAMLYWMVSKEDAPSTLVSQLQTRHEQQMQMLYTHYEDQQALTENWQQQLQDLDSAAQEILNALKHDPHNKDLLKMLGNVYQQQLDLVARVHQPKWQYIYDSNREVAL